MSNEKLSDEKLAWFKNLPQPVIPGSISECVQCPCGSILRFNPRVTVSNINMDDWIDEHFPHGQLSDWIDEQNEMPHRNGSEDDRQLDQALQVLKLRTMPDHSILLYDKTQIDASDVRNAVRHVMKQEKRQIISSIIPVDGSPIGAINTVYSHSLWEVFRHIKPAITIPNQNFYEVEF